MRRRLRSTPLKPAVATGLALLFLVGCQSIQEQEAIRPLREHGPRLSYDELLLRARRQSDLALDRAFRNNWGDVQDVATALEQTVLLLPEAPEAPPRKEEITKVATELAEEARKLNAAAREVPGLTGAERDKKIKEVDALLLTISRSVRTLWANP